MKTILQDLVTAESAHIHKPDGKLLMKSVMGILRSGSTKLTRLAISLKEGMRPRIREYGSGR